MLISNRNDDQVSITGIKILKEKSIKKNSHHPLSKMFNFESSKSDAVL